MDSGLKHAILEDSKEANDKLQRAARFAWYAGTTVAHEERVDVDEIDEAIELAEDAVDILEGIKDD